LNRRIIGSDFDLGGTLAFRALGLVFGLGSSLLIVGTITRTFGAQEYAAFALLASFINLLPFADLGLGASVVNAVSDGRSGKFPKEAVALHVSRARDVLTLVAVAISGIAVLLLLSGTWPALLGNTAIVDGIPLAATITLALVGIGVPLGIGNRILQGAGRMRTVVQIALLGPLIQALGCVLLTVLAASAISYAYLPGIAYVSVAGTAFFVAIRSRVVSALMPFVALRRWKADVMRLADTAVPFLIISIALAVGFQSHRLILAQLGTTQELAVYSMTAQFAGPVLALITVAAQNLWSKYRVQMNQGDLRGRSFLSNVWLFVSLGVVAAICLFVAVQAIGGPLTAWVVEPAISVSLGAAAYVIVVATHQPSAMLLNSPRGLWLQATLVTAASIVSVVLMILLVPEFGAAVPYAVFAGAMLVIQVVPTLIVAILTIKRAGRKLGDV
jgi:O-antigen/teichoic acid export membrane protein